MDMKKVVVLLVITILLVILTSYVLINRNNVETITNNQNENNQIISNIDEKLPSNSGDNIESSFSGESVASKNNEINNNVIDLDFEFLKLENNGKNMIYSPLSIKTALLMLNEGATGETKAEIGNLIKDYVGKSYPSSKNISFANSVFIRDTFRPFVLNSFGDKLRSKYGAEVFIDDFSSAKRANDWISEKTLGLIKETLKDKDVQNPESVMLLINALGIDMEWKEKLDDNDTYSSYFAKDNKYNSIDRWNEPSDEDINLYNEVAFMPKRYEINTYEEGTKFADWGHTSTTDFKYYVDEDITVYAKELKEYDGTNLQFIAFKPEKTSLSEYIKTFDTSSYEELISKLKPIEKEYHNKNKYVYVKTILPKFKFDYSLKLKDDLLNLGMTKAFDRNSAEFFNIIDKNGDAYLYVADAIHKANIDLSEEGIKAAAVTVLEVGGGGEGDMPEFEYINVNIDKPFIFVIRDTKTNDIWFTGAVYEPTLWEEISSQYEPLTWEEYQKIMGEE